MPHYTTVTKEGQPLGTLLPKQAQCVILANKSGGVPERTIGAVSKTVVALVVTVGSNPTPSASMSVDRESGQLVSEGANEPVVDR